MRPDAPVRGLQKLYDAYGDRGFTVLGFPCNQFLEQEPGTADEIQEFCSVNYGVTFPLMAKIEVNGEGKDPLYAELEQTPDVADGHTGDIRWNFEKFLVSPEGEVVGRFNPRSPPRTPPWSPPSRPSCRLDGPLRSGSGAGETLRWEVGNRGQPSRVESLALNPTGAPTWPELDASSTRPHCPSCR